MKSGVVLSIHLQATKGDPPRPAERTRAVVARGLEGDYHGASDPGSERQVLLVDRQTLDALGFSHGALREQLTVDFEGLDQMPRGARLRVGQAELEITGPCEPCESIGEINRVTDPEAMRRTLERRRGVLARVVAVTGNGRIRRGDAVSLIVAPTAPSRAPS